MRTQSSEIMIDDRLVVVRLLRPLITMAHVGHDPLAAADAQQRIEALIADHLAGKG